jgi:hypothetical protein
VVAEILHCYIWLSPASNGGRREGSFVVAKAPRAGNRLQGEHDTSVPRCSVLGRDLECTGELCECIAIMSPQRVGFCNTADTTTLHREFVGTAAARDRGGTGNKETGKGEATSLYRVVARKNSAKREGTSKTAGTPKGKREGDRRSASIATETIGKEQVTESSSGAQVQESTARPWIPARPRKAAVSAGA